MGTRAPSSHDCRSHRPVSQSFPPDLVVVPAPSGSRTDELLRSLEERGRPRPSVLVRGQRRITSNTLTRGGPRWPNPPRTSTTRLAKEGTVVRVPFSSSGGNRTDRHPPLVLSVRPAQRGRGVTDAGYGRTALRRGGGLGNPLVKPSMCSFKSAGICCQRGSSTNCTLSRRASFAAGTKSASPETRMMIFTWHLSVSDAISSPIRMSTPFYRKAGAKSSSVRFSTKRRPFRSSFCGSGFKLQDRRLSFRTSPSRTARFRELRRASNNRYRKRA